MISTVQDVSELQRSRAELRAALQKLELAMDSAKLGVWTLPVGGEFLEWNDQMYAIYRVSRDEFVPRVDHWLALVHDEDLDFVRSEFERASHGESVQGISFRIVRPDGDVRPIAPSATPVYDGEVTVGFMGINIDQTEIAHDRNALQEIVARQDFLIRETNHRIESNLATVLGLLGFAEASAGVDLSNVKRQLDAIRSVHELILEPERIDAFNVRPYLERIVDTVVGGRVDGGFTVRINIDDVSIHSRVAVSLGLLVTELVANSVRHGIITDKREFLEISFVGKDDSCRLVVENSGTPFPDRVSLDEPESLGLRLVRALGEQLDATLSLERHPNTRFIVDFPLRNPDAHG